jgi:hypothetical protein
VRSRATMDFDVLREQVGDELIGSFSLPAAQR